MTQSIWSKLFTALRGGANEVGESIVDQQALRILDQEIRDADSALANAKRELVTIMATVSYTHLTLPTIYSV